MTMSLEEMSPVLLSPDALFIQHHCAWAFHRGYELLPDLFEVFACHLLQNGIQQCHLLFFPVSSKRNSRSNPVLLLLATHVFSFLVADSKYTFTH